MSSREQPECEWSKGLPSTAVALRVDLLRRLELLEREVRALIEQESPGAVSESVVDLRAMEEELRRQLTATPDSASWPRQRTEIIELWKRHREAFEELAARCRRRYRARPGQRRIGPRW